jgi:metallo-beta-lactamase family protein
MTATTPAKIAAAVVLLLVAAGITALLLTGPSNAGSRASAAAATTTTTAPAPEPPARALVDLPAAPAAAQPPAAVTPPRKVFDVITARSCDNRKGPRDGFEHLGFISRGDWVEYDNVEFPPSDPPRTLTFCAVVCCPKQYAGSDIQVHLNSPDGPLISTLTVEATAGYSDFVCQDAPIEMPVAGPQDVFLVFTGGGFNVRSIKFAVVDGRPADVRIPATSYAMAKKVNENGKTLVNVRDGAWARYDALQFPTAGVDTLTLAYAVDPARAGGTISVRLDLPTATPIGEIPLVSTGGYNLFIPATVPLKQKITGNHDVYLTFSGKNQGYQGLADVAWFTFNAPGAVLFFPPPPPPPPPRPNPPPPHPAPHDRPVPRAGLHFRTPLIPRRRRSGSAVPFGPMRIQFCGADRTVTGSCHLLEVNGLRLLLDCGMYQGARDVAARLNAWLPRDATKVDAVILSHGHLDHCGKLPVLARDGYRGPIYCTPGTAAVTRIVLNDAARIQEEDASYLNRRARGANDEPVRPLFTSADVSTTLRALKHVPYRQRQDLGNGVSFTFHDAGHILGSAYVLIEWSEPEQSASKRTLLFTADVGRYDTPILRDPEPVPGPVDLVITESTYGNAKHAPMSEVGPQLLAAIQQAVRDRSRILVPSFAVGRTQTILWYVQKFITDGQLAPLPVFVDSPMGIEASKAYSEFRDNYDDQTSAMIGTKDLFGLSHTTFTATAQESRKINGTNGPAVIIASSPTCEFGRILHHLALSVEREKDLVLFVGYTPPNTLGRRLQDGAKRVRIFDRWYDVKCQVRTIHGLSAHADADELLRFLTPTAVPATTAFVVHGEEPQAETFASRLLAAGLGRVTVPAMESSTIAFTAPAPPVATTSSTNVRAED